MVLACFLALALAPQGPAPTAEVVLNHPPVTSPMAPVVRRYAAPEARQGVAVDRDAFYAITNAWIAKYDKRTGKRLAEWRGEKNGPIKHLDSGVVVGNLLVCAHSNFPETPMASSIEIWDTRTLKHVRSHSFGLSRGSATWADWHDGAWWVTFGHYAGKGGEAGKGPDRTVLVKYDRDFRELAAWSFPKEVVSRWDGMSNSGGSWGRDGLLYATGHHSPEVYVLRIPKMGPELELVRMYGIETEGQGIACDRSSPGDLYSIQRKTGEVLVTRPPEGR